MDVPPVSYTTFGPFLRRAAASLPGFRIDRLAEFFGLPSNCFTTVDAGKGIILAYRRSYGSAVGYLLRGTFFFDEGHSIIRGYPKITYGSQYQGMVPFAVSAERELLSCLKRNRIIFEEKIDGINIRMYQWRNNFYFATRMVCDGSNIKGDIQWCDVAKRIIGTRYPGAYDLVNDGYIPVFEIVSPLFTHLTLKAAEEDAYLIDVMKDFTFLTRERKEEVAAAYHLKIPRIVSEIHSSMSPEQFRKKVSELEYYAETLGLEGVVARSYKVEPGEEPGDQVYLKVKVGDVRKIHWGGTIPKRFIVEAIRGVRMDLSQEEFLDRDLALGLIREELSQDVVIGAEVDEKVVRLYEEIRGEVEGQLRAEGEARSLIEQHRFPTKKEAALWMQANGIDRLVMNRVFAMMDETEVPER